MEDTPLVVLLFSCLLRLLRHALAAPVLPSYLGVWACERLASHSAFQGEGRLAHCVLALPRLVAVVVGLPVALLGPIVLVEILSRQHPALQWPTGLAAGLSAVLMLHGLWLICRHPQLPKCLKVQWSDLAHGCVDALFDMAALLALAFVLATLLRVPALVGQLTSLPEAGSGGKARMAILENALLVFLDALCIPAVVVIAVCPWRWQAAWRARESETPRAELIGHALQGVLDMPFLVFGGVACANPWRLQKLVRTCADEGASVCKRREAALEQFACLLLDILCASALLVLLVLPWRFVLAVRELWKVSRHFAVFYHLIFGPADLVAMAAMVVCTPSHRVSKLPWPCGGSWDWNVSSDNFATATSAHAEAISQLFLLLLDIVICGPPLLVVVATLYRVPALGKSLRKGRERRLAICRQFGLILVELPILALSVFLLLTPWRFVWLIKDVAATKDVNKRRFAVFFHVQHAIADVLMMLSLLVVLLAAPYRLLATSFRGRLRAGLQHVGASAMGHLHFRRPQPRVPVEGSKIDAFHGTSVANALAIERGGFIPSRAGMLGPGVYVSRDPSKAESYGKMVLRLEVTIGRLLVIDAQSHPRKQTWSSQGYDLAWVPAGCGMVPSNREEGCVKDPRNIRVIGRYERTRHPHALCVQEALQAILDPVFCGCPFLLVVVTVYRLPALVRTLRDETASDCDKRLACICQGAEVVADVLSAAVAAILLVLGPVRFVFALSGSPVRGFGEVSEVGWRIRVPAMLIMAVMDLLCIPALLGLGLTAYRLPILRDLAGELEVRSCSGYFAAGYAAPMGVLHQGAALLLDLCCLVIGLVTLCSWRCRTLLQRLWPAPPSPSKPVQPAVAQPPPQLVDTPSSAAQLPSAELSAPTRSATPQESWLQSLLCCDWGFTPWASPGVHAVKAPPAPTTAAATRAPEAPGPRCMPSEQVRCHGDDAVPDPDLEVGERASSASALPEAGQPTSLRGSSAKARTEALAACRAEAVATFVLLLLDVLLLAALVLVLVLLTRSLGLCRRAWRMLAMTARKEVIAEDAAEAEAKALADATRGLEALRRSDACVEGQEQVSLTFFRHVILDELWKSVVNIPVLPLLPLFVLLPLCWLVEGYCRVRFSTEAQSTVPSCYEAGPPEPAPLPRLPRSSFAAPVPAVLKFASGGSEEWPLWRFGRKLSGCLALLALISLHELATALFLAVVLAVIMPLSLAYPCWPQTCKDSWTGRGLIRLCHCVQTLVMPALLALALFLVAAPSVWWWWPQGGWLALGPLRVQGPADVPMPPWSFWVGQATWFILCAGAAQLLARAPRTGAFAPACLEPSQLQEAVGLLTGSSVVWRRGIDRVVGAIVWWSYRHRRTCCFLGEFVLAAWLFAFALWPLVVPALGAGGRPLGQALAWWGIAALVALFFMFHAVRIGKAYWRREPATQ
uniref:PARP n=1 Tax=Alexandrium monilatum TaxID=311494 RepID=A0A7S4SMX1_9DINO